MNGIMAPVRSFHIMASGGDSNERIIRTLRIAKIGRAAGKRVGSHWKPHGIGQVRAGFHHNDLIAGPGEVEAELIHLHANAGRADLR